MSAISTFSPFVAGTLVPSFFAANPLIGMEPIGDLSLRAGGAHSLLDTLFNFGSAVPSQMTNVPGFAKAHKDWTEGRQVGTIDPERIIVSLTKPNSDVKTIEGTEAKSANEASDKDTALTAKNPSQALSKFTRDAFTNPLSLFALSPFRGLGVNMSVPDGIVPVSFETEFDGGKTATSMYNTGEVDIPGGTFQQSGFSSFTVNGKPVSSFASSQPDTNRGATPATSFESGMALGEVKDDDETVASVPDSRAFHPSSMEKANTFDEATEGEALKTVEPSLFASEPVTRVTEA